MGKSMKPLDISLPFKFFIITVLSILLTGLIVNMIPELRNDSSKNFIHIKSLLIAFLLIPELYLFLYKPLKLYFDTRKKAEVDLRAEHDKAKEALAESEARYRSLIRQSSEGVIIFDPVTRIVQEANSQICNMLGYDEQEIVGKPLEKIALMDLTFLENNIKKMSLKGEIVSGLRQYRKKEGSLAEVEVYASLIRFGKRKVILANIRNVTERIKAETALKNSLLNLKLTLNETVNALVTMAEKRDPYTAGHQHRVAMLACTIARELGLSEKQVEGILIAGKLHDIGKINIPIEILNKPGRLTDTELGLIKCHSQTGYDILEKIPFEFDVAQTVYQHHEKLDGSGYPLGLKGKDILLEAKILCVADVVEAMASHRPYRPALGFNKATEEITKNKGVLYEADIVDACLNVIGTEEFNLAFKRLA